MPVAVGVWSLRGNSRSQRIAEALAKGVAAAGDRVLVRSDGLYRGQREPVAAFYGYQRNHPQIMREYISSGRKVVFVDLGYWGRREGGRWEGYHKVAVNSRHPTAHFQKRSHPDDRLRKFRLKPQDWRKGGTNILVAGMSGKSAESYGYQPEEWERWAVSEIRKHTDRPILYRPKPSWTEAGRIEGTTFNPPSSALGAVLRDCHAVVTHHSNVSVDALVAGVPVFCWEGVAVPLASQDLSQIEKPSRPDGRHQWMADIAYAQWTVEEMRNGVMWRFLKDEGLIP